MGRHHRLRIPAALGKLGGAVSGGAKRSKRPSHSLGSQLKRSHPQELTGTTPDEIESLYEFEFVGSEEGDGKEPSMLSEAAKAIGECLRGLANLPGRRARKKAAQAARQAQQMHAKMNERVETQEAKVDVLNIKIAKSVASGDRTMAKQRKCI